jgi:hypothetical protein
MQIKNARPFPVATTFGAQPQGQCFLTVVVKGTFRLESSDQPARPLEQQAPILHADEPYDPDQPAGLLRFEQELAPFKPRADIVLVGNAYPLAGRSMSACDVVIQVGRTRKVIRAVGERRWSCATPSSGPVQVGPLPFDFMPLTYERAFGGTDEHAKVSSPMNPFGRGLIVQGLPAAIHGTQLPNLEDPAQMIHTWDSYPTPVGCGFFPRTSAPRCHYLGTYDETWRKARAPHPPDDFRFEFYNSAHPDLQVDKYLVGNEAVSLSHVIPGGGGIHCLLPCLKPSITVQSRSAGTAGLSQIVRRELATNLDTLVLVPEQAAFFVLWRAIFPLKRHEAVDEIEQVQIEYQRLSAGPHDRLTAGGGR